MTKLEEKLKELGYIQDEHNPYGYYKDCQGFVSIYIYIRFKIKGRVYSITRDYEYQFEIDNLQQAFNEMQKDLELLKELKQEDKNYEM